MKRAVLTAFATLALATSAAACGGDDDPGAEVASLGTDPPSEEPATTDPPATQPTGSDPVSSAPTDGSTPSSTPMDPQEAALAYTECMREHGIDMPDPEFDENGGAMVQTVGEGSNPADQEELREAEEACSPIMENAVSEVEIDPEQEAEMREQMLEYAQCMREHGIDMPDPEFTENGGVTLEIGGPDGPEFSEEEFNEANEACGQGEGGMFAIGPGTVPGGEE
jgi:hypothetical protein